MKTVLVDPPRLIINFKSASFNYVTKIKKGAVLE